MKTKLGVFVAAAVLVAGGLAACSDPKVEEVETEEPVEVTEEYEDADGDEIFEDEDAELVDDETVYEDGEVEDEEELVN